MSESTVTLLQAASRACGGNRALADRLGIDEGLLIQYLADTRPLPDALLLKAIDLIMASRQTTPRGDPLTNQPAASD